MLTLIVSLHTEVEFACSLLGPQIMSSTEEADQVCLKNDQNTHFIISSPCSTMAPPTPMFRRRESKKQYKQFFPAARRSARVAAWIAAIL